MRTPTDRPARSRWFAALALVGVLATSCSTGSDDATANEPDPSTETAETEVGTDEPAVDLTAVDDPDAAAALVADRPFEVREPAGYDGSAPAPLLVVLHGYGATGAVQTAYLGLEDTADANGMLLVAPDGTVNEADEAKQFWDATEACCARPDDPVDDSGYLRAVIAEVARTHEVDPDRVYLVGHSNGGFMSFRMACDHAEVIAGIVTIAGATFDDPDDCTPAQPVAVLAVHGTDDDTIAYDGGDNRRGSYPSAPRTAEMWATYNGCDVDSGPTSGDERDVVADSDPATVETYEEGCEANGVVELWTLPDGVHIPAFNSSFSDQIVEFLQANPKA